MRSLAAMITVLGLVFTPSTEAQEAQEITGIRMVEKDYDPVTGQLSAVLRNESGKTLTAWRVSVVVARGTEATNVLLDFDYHTQLSTAALQASRPERGLLLPGEIRPLDLGVMNEPMPMVSPPAISLRLAAAIFEDGTTTGDSDAIEKIASDRLASLEELDRALQAVTEISGRQGEPRELASFLESHGQLLRTEKRSTRQRSTHAPVSSVASPQRKGLGERLSRAARSILEDPRSASRHIEALLEDLRDEYHFRSEHVELVLPGGQVVGSSTHASKEGNR